MKTAQKYTVRRHLQRGETFGFFQIREHITDAKQGKVVELINPDLFNIAFLNCKLYSQKNQAKKIFTGETTKKPCAWIIFDSYTVTPAKEIAGQELEFSPRKNPYWIFNNENADNKTFKLITMNNAKLFI